MSLNNLEDILKFYKDKSIPDIALAIYQSKYRRVPDEIVIHYKRMFNATDQIRDELKFGYRHDIDFNTITELNKTRHEWVFTSYDYLL